MVNRDAGEPFYTLDQIHKDFYKRLTTDERLTSEYRIDTWGEGRFNPQHLPPTGIHGRYQRLRVMPLEETTGFYNYKIDVVVWVLINQRDVATQYALGELYLGEITQVFTEKPDDWSLDGIVLNIEFAGSDYLQDWANHGNSVLLCSARFAIYADIEHMHTQS